MLADPDQIGLGRLRRWGGPGAYRVDEGDEVKAMSNEVPCRFHEVLGCDRGGTRTAPPTQNRHPHVPLWMRQVETCFIIWAVAPHEAIATGRERSTPWSTGKNPCTCPYPHDLFGTDIFEVLSGLVVDLGSM